jgi:hypothetical protein
VPSVLPTVSRRRLLVGGAALALLGGTVATACGSSPPAKDIDALLGQLKRAQSDGELAGNAATAAPWKLAAALNAVAGQRAAHAKALSDEITRISGEAPPTTSVTSATSATFSPSAPTTTSGPPPKPPTAADVVAALQQSAEGASLLATQQSGYRAGLLGSIAAACTAAATVALTGSGQAS